MGRLTHRTGEGWTYFVTTKGFQSANVFQAQEVAGIVVQKMLEYRDKGNYLLHEFVLMPNHLHLLITPAESVSLEKCVQLVKGGSSHEIHQARGGRMPLWQSGFHESRVRDWSDYRAKADYIRFNPVAGKLVERPEEWQFGSASGAYKVDPIPQGLKPLTMQAVNVGAEAPTPGASVERGGLQAEKAIPQGLKPTGVQAANVGPKGPTPGAATMSPGAKAPLDSEEAKAAKA